MWRHRNCQKTGLRLFRRYVVRNCFEPLDAIVARFNSLNGISISKSTARRYVKKLKMRSCVAVQKPFLSKGNIAKHITWAHRHRHWSLQEWSRVMFTDESTLTVRPVKNRLRVWRQGGDRLHISNVVPAFKSGRQTISVWGGFSARGRTAMVGATGSFDSKTYSVIISNHAEPFIYDIHNCTTDFILVQDNCGPHRAKRIIAYFEKEDVTCMPWPSQSPDLNPIENIWGLMRSCFRKRSTYPKSPIHLFSILSEMWNSLPESLFKTLVQSMTSRLESVLVRKGRSIKYWCSQKSYF